MKTLIRESIKAVLPQRLHRAIKHTFRRQRRHNLKWELSSGIKISVSNSPDWVIYNDIFVNGEYDVPILDCLQRWPYAKPIRVFDLGANVGYFALRFIDLVQRQSRSDLSYHITMVEGSPAMFRELQTRIHLSGVEKHSLSMIHGLVGKRDGTGTISENDFHPISNIMQQDRYGVPVHFTDLTSLKKSGERIQLLKCDIEGAEQQFIENYPDLLRNVESAVFELHRTACDTNRCIHLLKTLGFSQCRFLRETEDIQVAHFLR